MDIQTSISSLSNLHFLLEVDPELAEKSRILAFDAQLLISLIPQAIAVLLLFYILAKLLFNPVREILKKRKDEIENTYASIDKEQAEAKAFRAEYDEKLKNIKMEADKILAHAHTRAVAREDEIVNKAQAEAAKIIERAHLEVLREKEQLKDDIRKEILSVATIMASKFVELSLSEEEQKVLISKTLDEMGDDTWLN